MSNKKILKDIKFQGKSSSTRGIKTKKLQEGFDRPAPPPPPPPPGLDRVKCLQKISKKGIGTMGRPQGRQNNSAIGPLNRFELE